MDIVIYNTCTCARTHTPTPTPTPTHTHMHTHLGLHDFLAGGGAVHGSAEGLSQSVILQHHLQLLQVALGLHRLRETPWGGEGRRGGEVRTCKYKCTSRYCYSVLASYPGLPCTKLIQYMHGLYMYMYIEHVYVAALTCYLDDLR